MVRERRICLQSKWAACLRFDPADTAGGFVLIRRGVVRWYIDRQPSRVSLKEGSLHVRKDETEKGPGYRQGALFWIVT